MTLSHIFVKICEAGLELTSEAELEYFGIMFPSKNYLTVFSSQAAVPFLDVTYSNSGTYFQFLAKQAICRGRFSCWFRWTFDMIPISVWRLYDQVWRRSAEL